MKQFLISGFILAFLLGSASAMAESNHRQGIYSSSSSAEKSRAGAQHKKILTAGYRDDYGHHYGHKKRSYDRGGRRSVFLEALPCQTLPSQVSVNYAGAYSSSRGGRSTTLRLPFAQRLRAFRPSASNASTRITS